MHGCYLGMALAGAQGRKMPCCVPDCKRGGLGMPVGAAGKARRRGKKSCVWVAAVGCAVMRWGSCVHLLFGRRGCPVGCCRQGLACEASA
eukprot:1158887-Pelagomonas_calceolata.AAC.4